jgi:hypothetical protein
MEITNIPCEKSVFLSPYECDFYKPSTPELGAPNCFTMEPLDIIITPPPPPPSGSEGEEMQLPHFDWPDAMTLSTTQQSTPASSVDETFTDEALFYMDYPYVVDHTALAPELFSWLPLDESELELGHSYGHGCPQPPG